MSQARRRRQGSRPATPLAQVYKYFEGRSAAASRGRSGRSAVFVDGAAEDTLSADGLVDRHDNARVVVGWPVFPTLVRSMPIEMPLVGRQHDAGVPLVVDQDLIGALPPYAAHEPFRVAVRPGGARRDFDGVYAFGGEHGVERGREFGVPVTDEEPERAGPVAEVDNQVAGLLGGPFKPVGFAVMP